MHGEASVHDCKAHFSSAVLLHAMPHRLADAAAPHAVLAERARVLALVLLLLVLLRTRNDGKQQSAAAHCDGGRKRTHAHAAHAHTARCAAVAAAICGSRGRPRWHRLTSRSSRAKSLLAWWKLRSKRLASAASMRSCACMAWCGQVRDAWGAAPRGRAAANSACWRHVRRAPCMLPNAAVLPQTTQVAGTCAPCAVRRACCRAAGARTSCFSCFASWRCSLSASLTSRSRALVCASLSAGGRRGGRVGGAAAAAAARGGDSDSAPLWSTCFSRTVLDAMSSL